MTEAEMDKVRTVARIICARALGGFCSNVGGHFGCQVGRGTSDYTKCVATDDQLALSGNSNTASEIIHAIRQP